jgi:hypothetical protein
MQGRLASGNDYPLDELHPFIQKIEKIFFTHNFVLPFVLIFIKQYPVVAVIAVEIAKRDKDDRSHLAPVINQ